MGTWETLRKIYGFRLSLPILMTYFRVCKLLDIPGYGKFEREGRLDIDSSVSAARTPPPRTQNVTKKIFRSRAWHVLSNVAPVPRIC